MAKSGQENVIWAPQEGPQTWLLTCDADEILYGGARGGGKSDGMLGDVLHHIAKNPRHAKAIIFRRTLEQLSDLIERAKQIFLPVGAGWRQTGKRFTFPGGATVRFAYLDRLDDAANYQGKAFTYVGIEEAGDWDTDLDEAGQPTQKAVMSLRAITRSAEGVAKRMVLTANPGGKGHDWVKKWFIEGHDPLVPWYEPIGRVWRVFIPSKLQDNKILTDNDPDYAAKLAASGPPWLVRAWLMGDWNAKQEGSIIPTHKIQRFDLAPKFDYIFQSWDTAFKEEQENDFTCGGVFGATRNELYLIDCVRKRLSFPDLKQTVVDLCAKWPSREILIEDKASGQSLLQELRRSSNLNVVPFKIGKGDDKVSLANAAVPFIDSGRLHFPKQAVWCRDVIEELSLFDHGPHDDAVDMIVHAILHYTQGSRHAGLMEYYRQQVERLKEEQENAKHRRR